MIGFEDPELDTDPTGPGDALGVATVDAALLVDRLAIKLLGACAPGDPAPEREARVRAALVGWREVEASVRELARVAGVDLVEPPIAANDQDGQRVNTPTRERAA